MDLGGRRRSYGAGCDRVYRRWPVVPQSAPIEEARPGRALRGHDRGREPAEPSGGRPLRPNLLVHMICYVTSADLHSWLQTEVSAVRLDSLSAVLSVD